MQLKSITSCDSSCEYKKQNLSSTDQILQDASIIASLDKQPQQNFQFVFEQSPTILSYNYSLLHAFYFVCIFWSLNSLMTSDQLFQSDCFLIWSDMHYLATESHELHC